MVAPGFAEPAFAIADAKPVDERGDVGTQSVPADVADLGADAEIVGGDLVAIPPPVVLGLVRAVEFPEFVIERIGTPERDKEPVVR